MAPPREARVLFVPGGGSRGVGEYARSLILAEALHERRPDARIEFAADASNPRFAQDSFPRHGLPGKASRSVAALRRLLEERRPDVVVFDNTGRRSQLASVRALGARCVYVTSLPQTRRRIFRFARLRQLDQLWIVQAAGVGRGRSLSAFERLVLGISGAPEVHFLDSFVPRSEPGRRAALLQRLGLDGSFALFAAGGGGWDVDGKPVAEVFLEAAGRVAAAGGGPCVAVMGPLYAGDCPKVEGVTTLLSLAPAELAHLLAATRLVACGGGGILGQAAAHGLACVAVPTGPGDQDLRVAAFAARGLVEPSPLRAEEIARRVLALRAEPERVESLRARMAAEQLGNGLPAAVENLERLLPPVPRVSPAPPAPAAPRA